MPTDERLCAVFLVEPNGPTSVASYRIHLFVNAGDRQINTGQPILRNRLKVSVPLGLAAIFVTFMSAGCAVPQPRGEGHYRRMREPSTGRHYHLYLPVDYIRNKGRHPNYPKVKKWPLVMTFHGMKPYDNARPQEREWEKEADVYGYIVCAPELRTSDSFMEYPLTREHEYVLGDRRNVLAIMDQVFRTSLADPDRVLATSWSCGGYLASYFVNRFPERFSCLAPRLSNFSGELLIEETIPRYKDRIPVAIYIGDGDFPACKRESMEAVAWYMARGFKTVRGKIIDHMGHRRIPQTAAAFFAEQLGIEPLRLVEASKTLAQIQMTEYRPPQKLIEKMAAISQTKTLARKAATTAVASTNKSAAKIPATKNTKTVNPRSRGPIPVVSTKLNREYVCSNAGRDYPLDRTPLYNPMPSKPKRQQTRSSGKPASAAGAARVASVTGDRRSTFLDPLKSDTATREKPGRSPKSGEKKNRADTKKVDKASSKRTPAPRSTKPRSTKPRDTKQQNTKPPSAKPQSTKPRSTKPQDNNRGTSDKPGTRQRPSGKKPIRSASSPRTDTGKRTSSSPRTDTGKRASSPSGTVIPTTAGRNRAKRANIRLSGPAVGTAPHYLSYSVSLPRKTIEGADFLWMDNGVWIGDEPRGVKILDTPGLHRISVLIITKSNQEYRGAATVQVLERKRQNRSKPKSR